MAIIAPGRLPASAAVSYQVIVQAGQAAPGGGTFAGAAIQGRFVPVLNASGQVAFTAIANTTGGGYGGIWSGSGGNLTLVARTGTDAPGTAGGVQFASLEPTISGTQVGLVVLNDALVVFAAQVTGTNVIAPDNDLGIWGGAPGGQLQLLARRGDTAPGTGGGVFARGFQFFPALNASNQVAFNSDIGSPLTNRPGTDDDRIYLGAVQNISSVLADSASAPGPGGGIFINFANPRFNRIFLNDAGSILMQADVAAGEPPTSTTSFVIGPPDSLQEIARLGNPLPGGGTLAAEGGAGSLGDVDFNNAGQAVMTAFSTNNLSQSGVWLWNGTNLHTIARTGDPAPGAGTGVVFGEFKEAAINASGQIVFRAKLTGTGITTQNDAGLWTGTASSALRLVAMEGQIAPGTTNRFRDFDAGDTLRMFYRINASGQIAFRAGIGTTFAFQKGIWLADGQGNLTLVARTGINLLDANGVSRLVTALETTSERFAMANARSEVGGGQDGRSGWFNDAGQIAFSVGFAGSSVDAIYLATVSTQPLLSLLNPSVAGGNFTFAFQTVAGQSYSVEVKTNLTMANWQVLTNFIGDGSLRQIAAPLTGGLQQFFRVKQP